MIKGFFYFISFSILFVNSAYAGNYCDDGFYKAIISPKVNISDFWQSTDGKSILKKFNTRCRAVVSRVGNSFIVIGNDSDFYGLEKHGISWEFYEKSGVFKNFKAGSNYTLWSEMGTALMDIIKGHESLVNFGISGFTANGFPIYLVEIAKDPALPAVRITGAHHGNEIISSEIVLGIIRFLLSDDGEPYINNFRFYIFPVVNPEGLNNNTRFNGLGYDINRDYGFGWEDGQSDYPWSQPETRTVFQITKRELPVFSLDYHSIAAYVNTVFDFTPFPSEDENLILDLGNVYAGIANLEVTIGIDWYQANGTSQDFLYAFLGGFGYTIETDQPDDPSPVVNENVNALAAILDAIAPKVLCGSLKDAETDLPLEGRLIINDHPRPFFSNKDGNFCHILSDENFVITAWAPGYNKLAVSVDGLNNNLDISLTKSASPYIEPFAVISAGNSDRSGEFPVANWPKYALEIDNGYSYSFGKGGFITLDLGFPVSDIQGPELSVIEGDSDSYVESVEVQLSKYPFGPYISAGVYEGTFDLDICDTSSNDCDSSQWFRYIRIIDQQNDNPGIYPGYDLSGIKIYPLPDFEIDEDNDQVSIGEDCNDMDKSVGTGLEEICDHKDNNCNGFIDENSEFTVNGLPECYDGGVTNDTGDASKVSNPGAKTGCSCTISKTQNSEFPLFTLFIILITAIIIRKYFSARYL